VARLAHLVDVVKLDPDLVQKWLDKADAASFSDMPEDVVAKCIAFVEARSIPLPLWSHRMLVNTNAATERGIVPPGVYDAVHQARR